MSPEIYAIILQTIVLLVALVAAALRGERRITKLEGKVEHVESICKQVPGISRALARLEGKAQQ
jgi:hypothetical protein